MALCADLIAESSRPVLLEGILADLEQREWQQTPGDIGHVYLIRALSQNGRSDALHRIYARTGQGSYGGILQKGLTSLPETWDATMDGYQSLNHCMLGHVMEWLYGYVGGIRQQAGSVGWRNVRISPVPGPLKYAEATLNTPAGKIASRWRIRNGIFELRTEIPDGITATAVLPSGKSLVIHPGKQVFSEPWPAK
jgi:hypothetical protein